MIDDEKRQERKRQKEKVRRRMRVEIDPNNYEFIPAKKPIDYYDNDVPQRVAIYVRVSTDDIRQTTSYELQKKYYEDFVNHHPNWTLVRIYADEGISGTSLKHRDAFNEMIADCRAGKIDLIITKSVSRFARNVMITIGMARELAALKNPVGIFFESEAIFSLKDESQMALTFQATMAEEESHTRSRSILRLIDGGQFVSAFINAADDGNAEEHLAAFFHGDGAFLCHIGLIHFYYRNPAFFCGIILRDIEVHGCFVEDIAVGSLYLDNRVPFSKGQLFRRDKRTFCIGVEHINGGGRRVSEGHCYGVAVRVINLEACTCIRDGLAGFCVLLHDFDEAGKGCIVDKVAISRPVLRDEHIKVGHQFTAFPAGNLMDGVDAVRHILGLCKAVFVTGEIITLGSLCAIIGACGFQIHGKLSTIFGCFDLRFAVIGVLNNGDIALCDLLGHIICRLIMLHGIKLRLCTDLMDGGIKQIALGGCDLSHRPVVIADILLGNELPVFVGGVGINKGFAL